MIKNYFIIVIFSAPLNSGLDYAVQTMEILGIENHVIGYSLGEPISWKDAIKLTIGKIKIIEHKKNFTVFRPFFFIPWQRFRFIQNLNYLCNCLFIVLYGWIRYFFLKKIVWFFEPFHMPPLFYLFYRYRTVYDCVDFYSAFSSYARDSELKIFHKVNYVIANSNVLNKFLSQFRNDVVTVPQGFSRNIFDKYLKSKTNISIDRKFTVGYVGGIDTRLNFDLLCNTAMLLPEINFYLVGPVEENVFDKNDRFSQHTREFFDLPNVILMATVSKQQIPEIIDSFDVGLIPYNTENLFNKNCFPMKLMEYFYMGCPVVSTDIEELQNYKSIISIVKTADETVNAIKKIQECPPSKKMKIKMKQVANFHEWHNKINKISKYITTEHYIKV